MPRGRGSRGRTAGDGLQVSWGMVALAAVVAVLLYLGATRKMKSDFLDRLKGTWVSQEGITLDLNLKPWDPVTAIGILGYDYGKMREILPSFTITVPCRRNPYPVPDNATAEAEDKYTTVYTGSDRNGLVVVARVTNGRLESVTRKWSTHNVKLTGEWSGDRVTIRTAGHIPCSVVRKTLYIGPSRKHCLMAVRTASDGQITADVAPGGGGDEWSMVMTRSRAGR